MFVIPRLRAALSRAHPAVFSFFAIAAAFSTYFSMYAFRKPYTAGLFEGTVHIPLLNVEISYKIALIISQLLGYCLAKFLGIKFISEMTPDRRAWSILACIAVAWGALLGFAIVPAPWDIPLLFLNGLPLGLIWGLVFGFLEGRRVTEVLGAGLSASYILASGVVKSIGRTLVVWGVPEAWMPFTVGALFALPMLLFVVALANLPPPTPEDVAARTERAPMDAAARRAFFNQFKPGLIALTALYMLLTAFRDFRDNFAVEIWEAVGYADSPEILATSEVPVTVAVLIVLGAMMAIKNNRTALIVVHVAMALGTLAIGVSTLLFQAGLISPVLWMITIGAGLYIAYVPYGCVLFDRLIAATGSVGTAGFLIYVTDSFGYVGSIALLFYKNFGQPDLSWLDFFTSFAYITAIGCSCAFAFALAYFARVTRGHRDSADRTAVAAAG